MALATSNFSVHFRTTTSTSRRFHLHNICRRSVISAFPRFSKTVVVRSSKSIVCAAASAAGGSGSNSEINPYEVIGVSPIEGFDKIKVAYKRKLKEAERKGDYVAAELLENAYDRIMFAQLSNRKKGVTFGSFQVSKDIKYADKQPIVPWGPRYSKSNAKDMQINMGISAVFIAWIFLMRTAEWKPLQFLTFAFVYRLFEKLKAAEPSTSPTITEDGEDEGRGIRMGKRLLRSLTLVFGCIALTSLGYTLLLNAIEFMGGFYPRHPLQQSGTDNHYLINYIAFHNGYLLPMIKLLGILNWRSRALQFAAHGFLFFTISCLGLSSIVL